MKTEYDRNTTDLPEVEPQLQEYEWTNPHHNSYDVVVMITPLPEMEEEDEKQYIH